MGSQRLRSGNGIRQADLAIRGVVCAVPGQRIANDHFHAVFGQPAVDDVVKMIGVNERRWSPVEQTAADLCEQAARDLLAELAWDVDSVDALIFVSQTPDYRLPATACALQGKLGLNKSCAAFDVNLGCSGYTYGLWLAARLIDGLAVQRVLLLVGDTISKTVDAKDRSTAMLFGDAGSATAIEFDAEASDSFFVLGTDGRGAKNLIIPRGGYRGPDLDDARLREKSLDALYMDGGEIFNFTLSSIPPLVKDLLEFGGADEAGVDAFLFHQANTFMLKHIAKKAKLPSEKVLMNMDRFGNTSSASIPLLIVDQLQQRTGPSAKVAMFGFGVGYSWAAGLLDLQLSVAKLIEV